MCRREWTLKVLFWLVLLCKAKTEPASSYFNQPSAFATTSTSSSTTLSLCDITYPSYIERRLCGTSTLLSGWLCDPHNTVSMSELYVLDDTLRRTYSQFDGQGCLCTPDSGLRPCWYRFGFAFARHLQEVDNQCKPDVNASQLSSANSSSDLLKRRAQTYSHLIREKWKFGQCGEDVLLLIVLNHPSSATLALSWGHLVTERLAGNAQRPSSQQLMGLIEEANAQLERGYPLNRVLNDWLLATVGLLRRLETSPKRAFHPRTHIPPWAWGVFGACVAAFAVMSMGLCFPRNSRRGNQRSKLASATINRRWKAGYAGDDTQPEAKTYVNMVQLMMPHSKPERLQQQV